MKILILCCLLLCSCNTTPPPPVSFNLISSGKSNKDQALYKSIGAKNGIEYYSKKIFSIHSQYITSARYHKFHSQDKGYGLILSLNQHGQANWEQDSRSSQPLIMYAAGIKPHYATFNSYYQRGNEVKLYMKMDLETAKKVVKNINECIDNRK